MYKAFPELNAEDLSRPWKKKILIQGYYEDAHPHIEVPYLGLMMTTSPADEDCEMLLS